MFPLSPGPGADSAPAPNTGTATTATTTRTSSTFSSLRVRNYRIFFTCSVIANTGTWMQRITQDWLVYELTGSTTAVGITTALQFLPTLLLGLYGGLLADRLDKRRVLLVTQAATGLIGLALAALTLSGTVHVYHVYALAFVLGLVSVPEKPARQTFVAELVGPGLLRSAVSLGSANFQTARMLGPAVAGVVITAAGAGWAFLLNGLAFIAPVVGLLLLRRSELFPAERAPRGKGQLREGLRYVGDRPDLLWAIVAVAFIGTFGFNFQVFLVAFADVFDSAAGGYGLLNSLVAVGAVAGALLAANRGGNWLRFSLISGAAFGVLLAVSAAAPSYLVFAVLMVPVGLASMGFVVAANSGIQLSTEPVMRGRVISLFQLVLLGSTPIGSPLMGWLSDTYGARITLLVAGVVCAASALAVALVLLRIGGLRLRLRLRRGGSPLVIVPRDTGLPLGR